jgi:hypothetical protein
LGDTDEETVIDAIKSEMRQQAKERDSLAGERLSLTAELSQVQISPELETEVLRIAAELREELGEADYETKRYLLDKLNFEAVFQDQNGERWLDVKCGIVPEWIMLQLW